jgi:hypothetical protein
MLTLYSKSLPADDPSFWFDYWKDEPDTVATKTAAATVRRTAG